MEACPKNSKMLRYVPSRRQPKHQRHSSLLALNCFARFRGVSMVPHSFETMTTLRISSGTRTGFVPWIVRAFSP